MRMAEELGGWRALLFRLDNTQYRNDMRYILTAFLYLSMFFCVMRVFDLNRFLEKNGPQANPGDKLVGLRGPIWWAAHTTHMLRVSPAYTTIYDSAEIIHAVFKKTGISI